jgi:predicted CXXCH cytochrome family protein
MTGVGAITNVYDSPTLSAIAKATTTADVDATDAPLCLSCHDGASLDDALVNPPNGLGATPAIAVGTNITNTNAIIDQDMRDDHPIGFSYAAAVSQDSELDTKNNAETDLGTGAVSYGGGDDVWCSSCHDVHGVTGVDTFLRINNTGSQLCLACHIK